MEDNATRPEPAIEPDADPALKARLLELEREAEELRRKLDQRSAGENSGPQVPGPGYAITGHTPFEPPASGADSLETGSQGPNTDLAPETQNLIPVATDAAELDEPLPLVPATPEQIQKAENLIRQARLARTRGQATQASVLLKEAEAAAPNAAVVLEFIGDDFAERKQYKNAREAYHKAHELAPKNVAIETKFANMVLKTEPSASFMPSDYETMASGKIAVVLSAIVPGLGQIVTKEFVKGGITILAYVGCLVWLYFIPNGLAGLVDLVGASKKAPFQPIVLVPMFLAFIIWISSIFDMNLKTKQVTHKPIERPKPPENLPFE